MVVEKSIVPVERIESLILLIRGQKVIIDADLAKLYGVSTKRLNEQVKRNRNRFPRDFMFKLNEDEKNELVANCDRFERLKHSSVSPYAFTKHGAIMAATILNSKQAVEVSIFVVRAFVKLRQVLVTHKDLAHKLLQLERKLSDHDQAIVSILDAIKQLMEPPKKERKPIGFKTK